MRLFFVALMVALISATSSANATSDWLSGLGYKARLIDGSRQPDGTFQAGFEIVLEKGWSTYWRVPGEYGIPPVFEFKQSSNVKDIVIHWPAPVVYASGQGLSVGYKNRVVLPFVIVPEESEKEVELNLSAFFGVCSDVCVPADAMASILLDPKNTNAADQPLIDAALTRVPSAPYGKGNDNSLDVKKASLASLDDAEYVYVQLQVPDNTNTVSILTEGPKDWYFDPYVTELSDGATKTHRIKIPLHRDIRTGLSGEEKLNVTVIADGIAIEKTISLSNL